MRNEDGFTVVEVLVGAIILVVGILGTLGVFDSSRRLTVVAERQTTLVQRAQNELERVLSLPYSQVALTGSSSSWSTTPGSYTYVNTNPGPGGGGTCPGTGPAPTYQPDHKPNGSTATEPLVINGCSYTTAVNGTNTTVTPTTGTIAPVTSWSAPVNGGVTASGKVYDFVTWASDPTCSQTSTPGSTCPTSEDYERVTVVVTLNGANQPTVPAIVSGLVTAPSNGHNPLTGGGTTCSTGPGTTGPCTGGPCPTCTTVTLPPCTGTGCGPAPGSPCYAAPPASTSWLTQPIPVGTTLKLTGTGEITLYLQTADGSTVNASICVGVYVVPGGLLAGTLPPVGATFTTSTSVSGVATPVTFGFNTGIGSAGYAVSGVAGTEVEVVVGISATTAVQIVSNSADSDQANLDVFTS